VATDIHLDHSPSLYYLFSIDYDEPECYEEAMQVDIKKKWEQGMKEEMDSLVNNQTWDFGSVSCRKKSIAEKMGLQVEGRRWRKKSVQG
jgi:hypothetical protein